MNSERVSYDFAVNRKLWEVDDSFINEPMNKFRKESSPLIETTVEQWGQYQFDNLASNLPQELLNFVHSFVANLGIMHSQYSTVESVARAIIHRIDYEEPYFFLVDMLVQIVHDEFQHTYRHKTTGDVLNPSKIEIFEVNPNWNFEPFYRVKQALEHPQTQAFMKSGHIPPGFSDREDALIAFFSKVASMVWGNPEWLYGMVEEMIENHIEEMRYEGKAETEQDHYVVRSSIVDDKLFWVAAVLGTITWLKGPAAVAFISEYHVIYDRLLYVNDNGTVSPWDESGGQVIVDGTDVYTLKKLERIANQPPDTCACCGVQLHCTKQVNITALQHPVCSCGETLDPMDVDYPHLKHNGRDCQGYKKLYAPRTGFVCQRCIFMTVNQMPPHTKCGRSACPAVTTCPHHLGNLARIASLTHQRTKQLTASQRG